jgi:rare lipoprotein A
VTLKRAIAFAFLAIVAAACASGGKKSQDVVVVTPAPHQKLGKPYKIAGRWYHPKHDPSYDERGIASWYGPNFHGKLTANGEIFDMNRLTAAHTTLPLPSLVRVTNLENGRQTVLRVNDRGPFAGNRIIDLSRAAAEELGTLHAGLGKVRVQYLGPAPMSEAILALGEPESLKGGQYAVLKAPSPKPLVKGRVAETVQQRIEVGEELPEKDITEDGIKIVVAEAEAKVATVPVPSPRPAAAAAPVLTAAAPAPREKQGEVTYFVQVGAFASAENAAVASQLLPEAVPISIETAMEGGFPLTKLRIGPYSLEIAAEEARRVAEAAGFTDAQIIVIR